MRTMIGAAAKWSLISNATQDPQVLAICREAERTLPAELAQDLREIIASAEGALAK